MLDRKIFSKSISALPAEGTSLRSGLMLNSTVVKDKNETMELLFHFSISDSSYDNLKERINNGDVLTLDELNLTYSPAKSGILKLKDWLAAQGFHSLRQSPDNIGLYAKATVAQIETSLQTTIVKVVLNGSTYNSASVAPSLPADVGEVVQSITGLQPHRQMHKKMLQSVKRGVGAGPTNKMPLQMLMPAGMAATGTASPVASNYYAPPYVVSEILGAYNAGGLGYTGSGQTIAILIDTVPNDSDLQTFWQYNYVSTDISRVTKINVNNMAQLPAVEGEETLDTEWSSGIAPGADIRIYATGTLSSVDVLKGLDMIIADAAKMPGLRQVSISIGLGELYYEGATDEVAAQHQKYMKLAAMGVNIFVSSGDAGSNPDIHGHSPTGQTQVEFAASDSFVIGVGGTTLTLNNYGGVASEVAWSNSGGGMSVYVSRPSWQSNAGFPSVYTRMVPDVSCVADPNTGALLVVNGQVASIGGTSWSTPVWAGFCAIINEARAKANLPPLPFLNPLLYKLAGTSCFRDITQGSNGAYSAGTGYDMVTGLGTPNVAQLIAALTK